MCAPLGFSYDSKEILYRFCYFWWFTSTKPNSQSKLFEKIPNSKICFICPVQRLLSAWNLFPSMMVSKCFQREISVNVWLTVYAYLLPRSIVFILWRDFIVPWKIALRTLDFISQWWIRFLLKAGVAEVKARNHLKVAVWIMDISKEAESKLNTFWDSFRNS